MESGLDSARRSRDLGMESRGERVVRVIVVWCVVGLFGLKYEGLGYGGVQKMGVDLWDVCLEG